MTLLEIIQAVVGETGVSTIPNQVVGNNDVQIQQLLL
jgi:hypothetical protein